jgi:glycerol-3-phosphate dehydrogenase
MRDVDVAIVGGGVIGAAVAARLSATTARVRLFERNADVADEASKGNAGITSSYYAEPGSLDAELISATYPRWEDTCARLDVPFRRIGGLITALTEEEEDQLPPKLEEARGCGVRAEIINGERARELEPLISPDCRQALWLPDEGIIDPMRLTIRLAELASCNGADIRLGSPVIDLERSGASISGVRTPFGVSGARFVVNASGLALGEISELAGGESYRLWPRKGEYWLLDRRFGSRLKHIVFATPLPDTKGIHVVPTTNGTALLGPSVEDNDRPLDKDTDEATLTYIYERARRLVPSVALDDAIKTFAAIRPASDERIRVRVDRKVPNLVHAANRSTGVSSSLGIADMVLALLNDAGLDAADRKDAIDHLPPVPRLLDEPDPVDLTRLDPRYGQVVCVCEQVSAAEIARSLEGPLAARSIDGIRKRTRATGGRCQGAVCLAGVAFMYSIATGVGPSEIPVVADGTLGT